MNIHLPAILMFTRGYKVLTHCQIIILSYYRVTWPIHTYYYNMIYSQHNPHSDSDSEFFVAGTILFRSNCSEYVFK